MSTDSIQANAEALRGLPRLISAKLEKACDADTTTADVRTNLEDALDETRCLYEALIELCEDAGVKTSALTAISRR